jgi:fatty acid desaturase
MWLLPLATWYQLVSGIRDIAEHAVVPDDDDPLRNTRTTYANPVERLLLAPYWVNYHLEHHLFMFVPCWRLPAAHRALIAAGRVNEMELLASIGRFCGRRPRGWSMSPASRNPMARRSTFNGSSVIAHRSAVISSQP